MKVLKETVNLMNGDGYKERFIDKYWQLKNSYEELRDFCNQIKAAELVDTVHPPQHDAPFDMLQRQQRLMGDLLSLLEVRAVIEGIDLKLYIKGNVKEQ